MKTIFHHIARWLDDCGRVFRNEWHIVLSDVGVLIFFIVLPLAYPIIYTLIYNTETVRDVPVVVVDDCRTASSRQLVQMANATPAIDVLGYAANLNEAKQAMAQGDCYAIMVIPHDYQHNIDNGMQATVPLYVEMSLLLRYRELASAVTDLQLQVAQDVTLTRVETMGASSIGISGLPVKNDARFLGDVTQGFASFVIPGIIVLILQQSMVLGIVLIGSTSRERRRRHRGFDPLMPNDVPTSALVWGKALCYTLFYVPIAMYVLHFIPWMFSLPHVGNPIDYLLFIFPMLLATALFGQFLVIFAKEREITFILVVFSSVAFLFLSGLTWPRYAMNVLWTTVGDLVPATRGVEGFIQINSTGASLSQVSHDYIWLWVLVAFYAVMAWFVTALIRHPDSYKK